MGRQLELLRQLSRNEFLLARLFWLFIYLSVASWILAKAERATQAELSKPQSNRVATADGRIVLHDREVKGRDKWAEGAVARKPAPGFAWQ